MDDAEFTGKAIKQKQAILDYTRKVFNEFTDDEIILAYKIHTFRDETDPKIMNQLKIDISKDPNTPKLMKKLQDWANHLQKVVLDSLED